MYSSFALLCIFILFCFGLYACLLFFVLIFRDLGNRAGPVNWADTKRLSVPFFNRFVILNYCSHV